MKLLKLGAILASLAASTAFADLKFTGKVAGTPVETQKNAEELVLTKHNHVALRGAVTGQTIAQVIVELNNLKVKEPILYIASPGGSVMAGNTLVQYILDSDRPITCVVDYGYSMGFVIAQACHRRIVSETSTMMQHQAYFGTEGQTENVKSEMAFTLRLLEQMDKAQAERIGISVEEFRKRILSDWWLVGSDIVNAKVADKTMRVRCEPELTLETKKVDVMSFFGTVNLVYSACPLARSPVEISFSFFDQEKQQKAYEDIMNATDPRKAKAFAVP